MNANGHEYELSALLKWAIYNFGLAGLAGVKMGVTLVALAAVYWIAANSIRLGRDGVKKFYGVYLGVILSNAYAGTSNISVILGNDSFHLLGLNSAQIALLLAFIPLFVVLFFDRS